MAKVKSPSWNSSRYHLFPYVGERGGAAFPDGITRLWPLAMLHAKFPLPYTTSDMLTCTDIGRRETMAKMSINAASKLFSVSRPTILKHLKIGYISGEKTASGKGWQIDKAELVRVYALRADSGNSGGALPANHTTAFSASDNDLKAENERLKHQLLLAEVKLGHAETIADERRQQLDQLMSLLTAPKRRGWWPW